MLTTYQILLDKLQLNVNDLRKIVGISHSAMGAIVKAESVLYLTSVCVSELFCKSDTQSAHKFYKKTGEYHYWPVITQLNPKTESTKSNLKIYFFKRMFQCILK